MIGNPIERKKESYETAFANFIADKPEKERTEIAHKMGHSGHTNKKMYNLAIIIFYVLSKSL